MKHQEKQWQLLEKMSIVRSLDPVQIMLAFCAKEKENWAAVLRTNSKSISKPAKLHPEIHFQDLLEVTTEVRANLLTVKSDVSASGTHC